MMKKKMVQNALKRQFKPQVMYSGTCPCGHFPIRDTILLLPFEFDPPV